jgi:hypothetical protein
MELFIGKDTMPIAIGREVFLHGLPTGAPVLVRNYEGNSDPE